MNNTVKCMTVTIVVLLFSLLQATAVWARSDENLQRDIEAQLAESKKLGGTRIVVHVDDGLVVLAGNVQIYEQKLVGGRIAWTTPGVLEVDNEIRVVPRVPLSDMAIERKIREILKGNARFRASGVLVQVSEGRVFLRGSFVDFSDPSRLKHKVAEIEGVVSIDMDAVFLAQFPGSLWDMRSSVGQAALWQTYGLLRAILGACSPRTCGPGAEGITSLLSLDSTSSGK